METKSKKLLYKLCLVLLGLFLLGVFIAENSDSYQSFSVDNERVSQLTGDSIAENQLVVYRKDNTVIFFKTEGWTVHKELCLREGVKIIPEMQKFDTKKYSSDGKTLLINKSWPEKTLYQKSNFSDKVKLITTTELDSIISTFQPKVYGKPKRQEHEGYFLSFSVLFDVMFIFWMYHILRLYFWANQKAFIPAKYFYLVCVFILAVAHGGFYYIFTQSMYISSLIFLKLVIVYLLLWQINNYLKSKFDEERTLIYISVQTIIIMICGSVSYIFHLWIFNTSSENIVDDSGVNVSNLISSYVFSYWFYLTIAWFVYSVLQYRKLMKSLTFKEKMVISKIEASKANVAGFQSRINPHFLYNTFNSISSMAKSEPIIAGQMAKELSTFYKYSRYSEENPLVTLHEELAMVKSYLKIEKKRFGDKLQYKIDADPLSFKAIIPGFIIQALVENAIKYGYNTHDGIVSVEVDAVYIRRKLTIRVFDSGPDFPEDMRSGYGINSIRYMMKSTYPNQTEINFVSKPKKCVEIIVKNPTI